MSTEGQVAAKVSRWGWLKPNTGLLKAAPFIGLLAGAAVVAPFVLGSFRNNRRFNEDHVPVPKALSDPLPPVLDFTPPPEQANTLCGEPMVEGAYARRVRMEREGIAAAGPDVASPNILNQAGVSVIDGKPMVELDNKHVNDLHKKDAATPSYGMSA